MDRLKRLIIEAHRRSLWQVLGIYLFSAWIALQVVQAVTVSAGLPDWAPGLAFILLVVGLPIVLATAVVQEGGPGWATRDRRMAAGVGAATGGHDGGQHPEPSPGADDPAGGPDAGPSGPASDQLGAGASTAAARTPGAARAPAGMASGDPAAGTASFLERHLTWKRAILGGVAAFGLLAVLVAAYLLSWALGIGPVGSLIARGVLEEGERIVLADFGNTTADAALGTVVTEALRIDLLGTRILRPLEPDEVGAVLQRMQVGPGADLTAELAREIALREGLKAVLEGEIGAAGTGYVLTATLRAAETGSSLVAFREAAAGPDELIAAIDRLSRRIRERTGESLRSINAAQRLEHVSTGSLDALRLYGEARRSYDQGDVHRSITLFEEALELDPEFGMAWRGLAVALSNVDLDPARQNEAAIRAFELRHRLSERERHHAAAFYHSQITGDRQAIAEAYRRVLQMDPDDPIALNNLANELMQAQDYEAAGELYRRAVTGPGATRSAFVNLVHNRIRAGALDEAEAAARAYEERYPADPGVANAWFWVHLARDDEEAARAAVEPLLSDRTLHPVQLASAHDHLARLALRRGRLAEAREHLRQAERAALDVGPDFHWLRRLFTAHAEVVAGDPERAVRIISGALADGTVQALPPASRYYSVMAANLAVAGTTDSAALLLEEWQEHASEDPRVGVGIIDRDAVRAAILLQQGDAAAAVELLERLRASRPCRTCYAFIMGPALLELGRLEMAAAEFESAARGSEWWSQANAIQHTWATEMLAGTYEELGDRDRALLHYQRVAELLVDADPELQPRVRAVRDRIASLLAER